MKIILKYVLWNVLITMSCVVVAQPQLTNQVTPVVLKNSTTLMHPFAGGLHAPQFNTIDLDADGVDELVVFDRVDEALHVYEAVQGTYIQSSKWNDFFPRIENWILLRDINCDGFKDIITSNGFNGVTVYQNIAGDSFHLITNELFYAAKGTTVALEVLNIDIPAVYDVDGDGYMDILSFTPNGGQVEYFRNLGNCETWDLASQTRCWGEFYESGISKRVDLGECPEGRHRQHAGSTVCALDLNKDNLTDLLIGDLLFDNLNYLTNTGTTALDVMGQQDTAFPMYDTPVEVPLFPSATVLELWEDKVPHIIVAPNGALISQSVDQVWSYKIEQNKAKLVQRNFLQEDMIDVGARAFPTFADVNGDGLEDLLIGSDARKSNFLSDVATLSLYLNVGTFINPIYEFQTDDYLKLSQYAMDWIAPSIGDLNDDGLLDLVIGTSDGKMHFVDQFTSAPQFYPEWQGLDVGNRATPFIYDLNADGLMDLIVGEEVGTVNYLENIGSPQAPLFSDTITNKNLGGVDARNFEYRQQAQSSPIVGTFEGNGGLSLVTGSGSGQLFYYSVADIDEDFELTDSAWGGDFGRFVAPAISNEGYLVVGNNRGGVVFRSFDVEREPVDGFDIRIVPNPTLNKFAVIGLDFSESVTLSLFDVSGKELLTDAAYMGADISIEQLPSGIYFVHIMTQTNESFSSKLVKVSN